MTELPPIFLERLKTIIPSELFENVLQTFFRKSPLSVRINTLKINHHDLERELEKAGIQFRKISWAPDALILENMIQKDLWDSPFMTNGWLYPQSLSSMLAPIVLDPQPEESILDMCAAPGSKTTQISALMKNTGEIIAVDAIRDRMYRLKSVMNLLGCSNVQIKCLDARRFHSEKLFDRILLDAPCSSEGRFNTLEPKSFGYWSPRKIREMVKKQRGLILHAGRLLKPGGVLVYSTCTFAPEENESIVDWFLRKTEGTWELVPCGPKEIPTYPAHLQWNERLFHPAIKNCLRVLPGEEMEGFFIAKLVRIG